MVNPQIPLKGLEFYRNIVFYFFLILLNIYKKGVFYTIYANVTTLRLVQLMGNKKTESWLIRRALKIVLAK